MLNASMMRYIVIWILASGLLFAVPLLPLGDHAAAYYSNLIQILSAIAAAVLCLRTWQALESGDPMRLVWGLMGIGVLSWGIGQIFYTGYVLTQGGEDPPYPWFSDIGFLLMPPLIIAALGVFIRSMQVRPPVWGLVVTFLVLLGTLALSLGPFLESWREEESLAAVWVNGGYALFDPVLLATTVLSASLLSGGLLALPWWLCFGGLLLYYLSNRLFDLLSAQDLYTSGSWADLGWPLAFTLIGLAAMVTYHILALEED